MSQSSDDLTRSVSQFEMDYLVRFVGGPLDGTEVKTDEYPNTEYLIHRHLGQEHLYRYVPFELGIFRAEYDGYLEPEGYPQPSSSRARRRVLLLALASATVLGALIALVAFA